MVKRDGLMQGGAYFVWDLSGPKYASHNCLRDIHMDYNVLGVVSIVKFPSLWTSDETMDCIV